MATATPGSFRRSRASSSTPCSRTGPARSARIRRPASGRRGSSAVADALVDMARQEQTVDPGPDPTLVVVHVRGGDPGRPRRGGQRVSQRGAGAGRHGAPAALRLHDRGQRRRARRHLHRHRSDGSPPAPVAPAPHRPPRPEPLPVPGLWPPHPPDPPRRSGGIVTTARPTRGTWPGSVAAPPPGPRGWMDDRRQRRRRADLHQPLRPCSHEPDHPRSCRTPGGRVEECTGIVFGDDADAAARLPDDTGRAIEAPVHRAPIRHAAGQAAVLRTRSAQSRMTSAANAASSRSVFHDDTLIRIAVAPSHWVGPHQIRPSAWISAISALGRRPVDAGGRAPG